MSDALFQFRLRSACLSGQLEGTAAAIVDEHRLTIARLKSVIDLGCPPMTESVLRMEAERLERLADALAGCLDEIKKHDATQHAALELISFHG